MQRLMQRVVGTLAVTTVLGGPHSANSASVSSAIEGAGNGQAPVGPSSPALLAGWRIVRTKWFAVALPPGWRLHEYEGSDAYKGELSGNGTSLFFEYSRYAGAPRMNAFGFETSETINGRPATVFRPSGTYGATSAYFQGLENDNRLYLYGWSETPAQQQEALGIFRSVHVEGGLFSAAGRRSPSRGTPKTEQPQPTNVAQLLVRLAESETGDELAKLLSATRGEAYNIERLPGPAGRHRYGLTSKLMGDDTSRVTFIGNTITSSQTPSGKDNVVTVLAPTREALVAALRKLFSPKQ